MQFAGPGRAVFLGFGAASNVAGLFSFQRGVGVTQMLDVHTLMSPDGEPLANIEQPIANNNGEVAFTARLPDLNPFVIERGLFTSDPVGNLSEMLRVGDVLPNHTESIEGIFVKAFNAAGQAVMAVELDSTDRALVRYDPVSGPTVIADQFALTPDGVGRFDSFHQIDLNERGQVAFLAETNDFGDPVGLYFFDPDFGVMELLEVGDALLGSIVSNITFDEATASPIYDERRGLNERGQVAFHFELEDQRSGIGVFTVPEPTTTAALVIVALLHGATRRPR